MVRKLKIAVIGNAGSGKTTLAFTLHEKLSLPLYHLDQYCWKPGWKKVEFETFKHIHDDLCHKDSWIVEGSYYKLLAHRAMHADIIIYIDIPTYICLWRVLKRALLHHGQDIPGNPTDCKQNLFTVRFWEFLQWIWSFNRKHRPEILKVLEEFKSKKPVYILKSQKEIDEFLKQQA